MAINEINDPVPQLVLKREVLGKGTAHKPVYIVQINGIKRYFHLPKLTLWYETV